MNLWNGLLGWAVAIFDVLGIVTLLWVILFTWGVSWYLNTDPHDRTVARIVRAIAFFLLAFRVGVKAFSSIGNPSWASFWFIITILIVMRAVGLSIRLIKSRPKKAKYPKIVDFRSDPPPDDLKDAS